MFLLKNELEKTETPHSYLIQVIFKYKNKAYYEEVVKKITKIVQTRVKWKKTKGKSNCKFF
jgi:hypothetical protein